MRKANCFLAAVLGIVVYAAGITNSHACEWGTEYRSGANCFPCPSDAQCDGEFVYRSLESMGGNCCTIIDGTPQPTGCTTKIDINSLGTGQSNGIQIQGCCPYQLSTFLDYNNGNQHIIEKWQQVSDGFNPPYCKKIKTNRSCKTNTYGLPQDNGSGCKTCPRNATCNGGPAFTCNDGYTKNVDEESCYICPLENADCDDHGIHCHGGYVYISLTNKCIKCPAHATCDIDGIHCDDTYFLTKDTNGNDVCNSCPHPGTGKNNKCYLDKDKGFVDDTGVFTVKENEVCKYDETKPPEYKYLDIGSTAFSCE